MLISYNVVLIDSDIKNWSLWIIQIDLSVTLKFEKKFVLFCSIIFMVDSGYLQVSEADQVIGPITSNLQVPSRLKNLSRILARVFTYR